MLKRIAAGAFFLFVAATAFSQCPERNKLWERLSFLANNSSAEQSPAQLDAQIKELLLYEAQIKNCPFRNDSTHAVLLQRIGATYYKQNEFVDAVRFTRQSIDLINAHYNSSAINPRLLIKNYFSLSLYYGQLNNPREKFRAIDSCVNVATRLRAVDYFFLYALSEKLEHLFNIGDYERCFEFATIGENAVRDFARGIDSINYLINFLTLKVNVLFNFKRFEQAEHLLTNKLEDCRRTGARQHLGTIAELLAQLYMYEKQPEKAHSYYQLAVEYNKGQGFNLGCMQALNNLGYNLYHNYLHDDREALVSFRAALSYANNDKNYLELERLESLNILANIAGVYVARRRFDSAFYYFNEAFAQIAPHLDENGLAENLESFVANKRTGYVTALVTDKANAFLQEYKSVHKAGSLSQAIHVFKIGDILLDRLRSEQSEVESKLFWRKESRRLFEGAIEACLLKNDAAAAFYFFEKSRSVLLHDQLIEQSWMSEPDILLQTQLKKKVLHLERELNTPGTATKRQSEIQQEVISQKQQIDELLKKITLKNPLYFQNFLDTSFITLEQVRTTVLHDHQALLEVFTGDSAVYLLSITDRDQKLTRLNKLDFDSTLNINLRYLSNPALINSDYAAYVKASRKLYQLFFSQNPVTTGRLIVSPDSYYFPFECLIDGGEGEPVSYLVEKNAISYTYSARFLMNRFNASQELRPHNFFGIAPVNFPARFQLAPLPGSDRSLQKIDDYFNDAVMLRSTDATRKNFLDNFFKYRVIQLYSHATDSSNGGEPAIYFADSTLYMSDLINSVSPATRLIVLSACKTGNGKLYEGEGVFSFNRQFAALGIPASIINLWSVDNEATYRLTEKFYKYLSEGLPSDIALQKAKVSFIKSAGRQQQLPYYWGAAILAGKTETIDSGNAGLLKWVIAALLICLIAGFAFTRSHNVRKIHS